MGREMRNTVESRGGRRPYAPTAPLNFLAVLITAVTVVTQRDITGLLHYEVDEVCLKEK